MRTECLEDSNESADQNSYLLALPRRSYQTRMWNSADIARAIGLLCLLASPSLPIFLFLLVSSW